MRKEKPNRPSKRDKVAKLFINVPQEVRSKFKAHCARNNKTMTDVLVDFMSKAK